MAEKRQKLWFVVLHRVQFLLIFHPTFLPFHAKVVTTFRDNEGNKARKKSPNLYIGKARVFFLSSLLWDAHSKLMIHG